MTAAPAPAATGRALLSTIAVLRELLPDSTLWQRFEQSLSPRLRVAMAHPPAPGEWVDLSLIVEIHEQLGAIGGDAMLLELGRRVLLRDIKTIYKVFMRFAQPETVVLKTAAIWSTYMRDNGTMRAELLAPGHCHLIYEGIAAHSAAFWQVARGTVHGVAEASRFEDVRSAYISGGINSDAVLDLNWRART